MFFSIFCDLLSLFKCCLDVGKWGINCVMVNVWVDILLIKVFVIIRVFLQLYMQFIVIYCFNYNVNLDIYLDIYVGYLK